MKKKHEYQKDAKGEIMKEISPDKMERMCTEKKTWDVCCPRGE